MIKKYRYLLLTCSLSLLPLAILFIIYLIKLDQNAYPFKRDIKDVIRGVKSFDIKYNSYYIAGHIRQDIFLGNRTAPGHLLKLKPYTTDTQHISIKIDTNHFSRQGNYKVYVDSLYFFMLNGQSRSILYGKSRTWNANKSPIPIPFFQQAVTLSNNSIAFKYVSTNTSSNSLSKSTLKRNIQNETLLEKQIDGLFCTDGILNYSRKLHQLIYVYRYRNEVLIIDTNLNLKVKFNTIDPINRAQIKVSKIKSNQSTTFSAPPLLVNAGCAIWDKYLFVHSKLMGKHEDETFFKNSTTIDVYDLEKYSYLYSFYIPMFENKPIYDFQVYDHYILTISDHYMNTYKIDLPKAI